MPKALRFYIGAGNRVRTGDLNLGKVALYQLSYSRMTFESALKVERIIERPPCMSTTLPQIYQPRRADQKTSSFNQISRTSSPQDAFR